MKVFPRRKFFKKFAISASVPAMVYGGCRDKKSSARDTPSAGDPGDPCADLSGISESDRALRRQFAYVQESPIPDNQCNNCNLYLPPQEEVACGGCMLFKGPVHADGYCTYWAPTL